MSAYQPSDLLPEPRPWTFRWLLRRLFLRKRAERDRRQVIAPAVRFSDLGVIALPPPATHDDILRLTESQHGSRQGKHRGEPGFVTADGRFLVPREALIFARAAGQIRNVGARVPELQCSDLKA